MLASTRRRSALLCRAIRVRSIQCAAVGAIVAAAFVATSSPAVAHTSSGETTPVAWCLGGPDLLRKTPVPFAVPAPPIGARSAIVMDAATGQVFLDHEGHERRAPASTTKIMTAMLAYRLVPPEAEDNVVVSQTDGFAMTGSSIMGLSVNQPVSLRDLLAGLMLPSGNDAAIELARNLAPTEADFVDAMNDTADDLHLNDTHFTNPHGLDDPQHYSTAYDLAELTRHAMTEQRFAELVARQSYHLGPSLDYDVQNGNSLLALYPGSTGVKIGWTEDAGWTFVASAERDGRSIIVSLMDTPDRDADAAALLDWAFALPPVEERTGTGSGLSCIPSRKLGHQG